jgi:hypothetical protein
MPNLKKLDQPVIFAISITLVVVGMISLWSWAAVSWNMPGPLSALKGGVVTS